VVESSGLYVLYGLPHSQAVLPPSWVFPFSGSLQTHEEPSSEQRASGPAKAVPGRKRRRAVTMNLPTGMCRPNAKHSLNVTALLSLIRSFFEA
jgi:hypothetical protein